MRTRSLESWLAMFLLAMLMSRQPAVAASAQPVTAAAESEDRPYAVATADPTTMYCPKNVLFDGRQSFHGGTAHRVVSQAWDLHHDGSFAEEVAGDSAWIAYGEVGSFTAALRVVDDGVPAQTDVATVGVTVLNRPPVADAGGPYRVVMGRPLQLRAVGSSDPDEACADAIATYAWDLDGDGHHDDATGAVPRIGWLQVESLVCGGACVAGERHGVSVRVTDRFGLTATAQTTVGIAAGGAPLTVTWPNGGEFLGTGRTYAIRWRSVPEVERVRVLLSTEGEDWQVIVPETDAAPGMATWTPPPAAYTTTQRGLQIKVVGLRDGAAVACDVSDAQFRIGPLDVRVAEKGAEFRKGSTVRLTWARHRTAARVAFSRISYSLDDGRNWRSTTILGNPGSYDWKVPFRKGRLEGCLMRVELYSRRGRLLGRDTGEGSFTILGRVDLTAPENYDRVYGGTIRTVRWDTHYSSPVASVKLRLTMNSGGTWTDLATIPGNPGHWHWQVPDVRAAASCRIQVSLVGINGQIIARDRSEGGFTIRVRGEAYATASPGFLAFPAASATPDYRVSWGASTTPGATYELEEATDPQFATALRRVYAGDQLEALIAGRTNGTTYYYRVRALREGWNPSAWVAGANGCAVFWDDVPPGPVTELTATVVGHDVDLAWVNPDDADFRGVRVLRRTDGMPLHAQDGALVCNTGGQACRDPALAHGTYYYGVFAYDAAMNYPAPATIAVQVDPPAAASPASITVPAASDSSTYLVSWEASVTAGVTYELQEAMDPGFATALRTAYAGGELAALIAGRANGATYYYRVRALGARWDPSAWVSGATGCAVSWDAVAPGPVSNLLATVVGNHVELTWVNPADGDLAGVLVLRRADRTPANASDGTLVHSGLGQSFVDAGLAPGTYYYAVFAHDTAWNFSSAATASALISPLYACESCHNGDGDGDGVWTGVGYDPDGPGPLPAAPNVMGDGVDPGGRGGTPKPYDDGRYGYNVNGHGVNGTAPWTPSDALGNPYLAANAACTACHDISIPAGTHLDGVLNSVELKQNPNENTAHLNATYIGASSPEWDVQLRFDDQCSFQCHAAAIRHRHARDGTPTNPSPPPPHPVGVVRFGDQGVAPDDGELIALPIDSALSTNAATAEPDFAPCISCHNPHGTDIVEYAKSTNRMLRDNWVDPSPLCAAHCHREYP